MKKLFADPELELTKLTAIDIMTVSSEDEAYGGDDDLALPGV